MPYQLFMHDGDPPIVWKARLGPILEKMGIQLLPEQIEALLGHLYPMRQNFSQAAETFCEGLRASGLIIDWGHSGIALTSNGVTLEMGALETYRAWISLSVSNIQDMMALEIAAAVMQEMYERGMKSQALAQALSSVWGTIALLRSKQLE